MTRLLIVFVFALSLWGQKQAAAVSMVASDWELWGGVAVPRAPSQLGGGWSFRLPAYDENLGPCYGSAACSAVAAAFTPYSGSIATGKVFSMAFALTGSPTFGYATEQGNTCNSPATVRFYIERKFNNGDGDLKRWWSNPGSIVLAGGTWTLSVPVDPGVWSSVYGTRGDASAQALKSFSATFSNPYRIGVVFGGGCFFGHGAYQNNPASGASDFQMLSFAIN